MALFELENFKPRSDLNMMCFVVRSEDMDKEQ